MNTIFAEKLKELRKKKVFRRNSLEKRCMSIILPLPVESVKEQLKKLYFPF